MKIKICGIKRPEDVSYINLFHPDYEGFILSKGYKRTVDLFDAKFLASKTDREVEKVGVFVNENPRTAAEYAKVIGLDAIQLHGDENEDYVKQLRTLTNAKIWKVFRVKSEKDVKLAENSTADLVLLDTYVKNVPGGTGKTINTQIIKNAEIKRDYVLAGGITPENVLDITNELKPFAVDVSGGVETDGVKDAQKIAELIKTVRSI